MNKLHEMIDKLIEVRVSSKLSPEANHNMDLVIESLIEEANTVPDWNDMTPEEIPSIVHSIVVSFLTLSLL